MRPYAIPSVALAFVLLFLAPLVRGQTGTRPIAANGPLGEVKAAKGAPAVELPVTRIVLFNAGVGYFHREGEVNGDAQLDLRFDEADVNDLLKSLVLTDASGTKPQAITYDNRLPVEFTLKGFAVDVTENPSMGQLMHQVRGEKIEVTDKSGGIVVGQIASVEKPAPVLAGTADPGEKLNLLTEDGLQTVELKQVKKFKFVRPELQAEFKKALELLAASRGDNKKTVSVVFGGNGKRRVAVGYVTESPLWKASYRLTVDAKGNTKLQGWATVENTTDEDWKDVKVGLVAGRPMTFQMDMYDPLFVPRPMVEPELFASLRPPMYQGGLNPVAIMGAMNPGGLQGFGGGGLQGLAGIGGLGGLQGGNQLGGIQLGNQLGIQGNQFGNLGGQFGLQGGFNFNGYGGYLPRVPRPDVRTLYGQRLSFEEYINRLRGNPTTPANAEGQKPVRDPLDKQGGALAVADGALGDMFEYTIAEPVTLPRQKSALLPIVSETVESSRVSIFNAAVLAKHPLLGLKLVNKTKLHLAQGPVAVYDGDTFAGDARLPDLKPGETRLVSYAIDLGTEVVPQAPESKSSLLAVRVVPGRIEAQTRYRWETKYLIRNRNPQERTVVIEHPRVDARKLISPEKAADQTRSFRRFDVPVKPGELATLQVVEESESGEYVAITSMSDDTLLYYSKHDATKPAVRQVLAKLLELRGKVSEAKKGIEEEQTALKEIADDQDRIRKNIERAPKESDAFKRYLKKFDEQETEIEKRQAKLKELRGELAKHEKALKEYAESAKAE